MDPSMLGAVAILLFHRENDESTAQNDHHEDEEKQSELFPILPGREFNIGRNVKADLRLSRRFVSRDHAKIIPDPTQPAPGLSIIDLSRRGTMVNGVRLTQSAPTPLHFNDTITIGNDVITVKDPQDFYPSEEEEEEESYSYSSDSESYEENRDSENEEEESSSSSSSDGKSSSGNDSSEKEEAPQEEKGISEPQVSQSLHKEDIKPHESESQLETTIETTRVSKVSTSQFHSPRLFSGSSSSQTNHFSTPDLGKPPMENTQTTLAGQKRSQSETPENSSDASAPPSSKVTPRGPRGILASVKQLFSPKTFRSSPSSESDKKNATNSPANSAVHSPAPLSQSRLALPASESPSSSSEDDSNISHSPKMEEIKKSILGEIPPHPTFEEHISPPPEAMVDQPKTTARIKNTYESMVSVTESDLESLSYFAKSSVSHLIEEANRQSDMFAEEWRSKWQAELGPEWQAEFGKDISMEAAVRWVLRQRIERVGSLQRWYKQVYAMLIQIASMRETLRTKIEEMERILATTWVCMQDTRACFERNRAALSQSVFVPPTRDGWIPPPRIESMPSETSQVTRQKNTEETQGAQQSAAPVCYSISEEAIYQMASQVGIDLGDLPPRLASDQ